MRRRARAAHETRPWDDPSHACLEPVVEGDVVGPEHAAAQHDLRVQATEARPARRASAAAIPDELVGEAVDDRAGDGVTVDRGREHGGGHGSPTRSLVEETRVVGVGDPRVRAAAADGRPRDRSLPRAASDGRGRRSPGPRPQSCPPDASPPPQSPAMSPTPSKRSPAVGREPAPLMPSPQIRAIPSRRRPGPERADVSLTTTTSPARPSAARAARSSRTSRG